MVNQINNGYLEENCIYRSILVEEVNSQTQEWVTILKSETGNSFLVETKNNDYITHSFFETELEAREYIN
ncbi:MAG: hypothetical protein WC123_06875 [Bacilli bacterium]